jgi:hypothetical protein
MPELMTAPTTPAAPAPATPAATQPTTPAKVDTAPKSFKISYEDGEAAQDVQLDDAQPSVEASSFKFDQLEPLKETHAELYKQIKAELSAKSRYSKHFKSPEEAASAADRIGRIAEQLGDREAGLDGIERALSRQTQIIQAAQSGDKATVESWFKENPAGVSDFVMNALEQLPNVDPKLAGSISGQAFVKALTQKDIYGQSALDALNALYSAVSDKPEAKKLLDRVAATVNQTAEAAAYKPDRTALQAAQLEKREAALFSKQIDLAADEVVRPAATRALQALTAEMKGITAEERAEYRQFMVTEFYKQLAKDQTSRAKYNELVKAKDQAGIVQLLKQNRAKLMNEAAKALYRAKLLNRQAVKEEASNKAEPGAGGTPASQGKQTTHWTGKIHPEKGPMANFDYERMNAEGIQALDRLFYVKNDKRLWSW